MGKMPSGILGPLLGSIGNVTSYVLNGQNITSIKTEKSPVSVKISLPISSA